MSRGPVARPVLIVGLLVLAVLLSSLGMSSLADDDNPLNPADEAVLQKALAAFESASPSNRFATVCFLFAGMIRPLLKEPPQAGELHD